MGQLELDGTGAPRLDGNLGIQRRNITASEGKARYQQFRVKYLVVLGTVVCRRGAWCRVGTMTRLASRMAAVFHLLL